MRFPSFVLALFVSALVACGICRADGFPSLEAAAAKLQAATVTVRVVAAEPSLANRDADQSATGDPRVSVFSGVSLGNRLVVTTLFAAAGARIRITLAGGEQADANARVLDEYCGLALLEVAGKQLPAMEAADRLPNVGSWVVSAAAWGVDKPVVSIGIVSGVDRAIPGTNYPPLVQCDLRSADTSSGAGIVNGHGQLLGVVVAAETSDQRRGWTYAVPVQHVQRLLRAVETSRSSSPGENVVVLKRRRPVVGMILEGEPDQVVVSQVSPGGPAQRAGIQVGDQILAADGVKIRDVYQVVRPLLSKQPGDTIVYLVQQQDGLRTIEVVLGGGFVLPAAASDELASLFQPKIVVAGGGRIGKTEIRELAAHARQPDAIEGPAGQTNEEHRKLLEKALESYRRVIEFQHGQLLLRNQEQARSQQHIKSLEAEIQSLKEQLKAPSNR
jgi:S1-C subfamily serine protease